MSRSDTSRPRYGKRLGEAFHVAYDVFFPEEHASRWRMETASRY
jgi:hypothetical protein